MKPDRLPRLSQRLNERQFLLRDTKRFLRRQGVKKGPAAVLGKALWDYDEWKGMNEPIRLQ